MACIFHNKPCVFSDNCFGIPNVPFQTKFCKVPTCKKSAIPDHKLTHTYILPKVNHSNVFRLSFHAHPTRKCAEKSNFVGNCRNYDEKENYHVVRMACPDVVFCTAVGFV